MQDVFTDSFPSAGAEERCIALSSWSETRNSPHGCYLVFDGFQVKANTMALFILDFQKYIPINMLEKEIKTYQYEFDANNK